METLEFRLPTSGARGLSIFLWLATLGWTVVVAAAIIDGAPWAAAFFAVFAIASAVVGVGAWRAQTDPPVIYRLDDTGLTAFGGRADRLEARLLRARLGTARWSDLTEVRTRASRSGIDLEFVSGDGSRPVLARPEHVEVSLAVFVLECRRRADPVGSRVAWPPDEAFAPRLRLRHHPGRRRWLPPIIIRDRRDGSFGLGYSLIDAIRLSVIAVGVVIAGAYLSVHQEMAPYSPRAATIFGTVMSIVVVGLVMSLTRMRLRAGPPGLEMDRPFRTKIVYHWEELAEVRWSELGYRLAVSTTSGRHDVHDLSMFAGATGRQGVREILLLCAAQGVKTAIDDPATSD
jgi:hypothetical protein